MLFVEDNDDLRAAFVELVGLMLERRCVGVSSHDELVALGDEALRCGVAVLDINLGPDRPSGLQVYAWLRQKGYGGRIVFLTGHASNHPLVAEARRIGDAEVFCKPIEPARLRTLIEGTAS